MEKSSNQKLLYACIVLVGSLALIIGLIAWEGTFQISRANANNLSLSEAIAASGIQAESGKHLLLWRTTRWCSLCASNKRAILEITGQFPDHIQLVEVDTDEKPMFDQFLSGLEPGMFNLYNNEGELITTIEYQDPDILRSILQVNVGETK